MACVFFFLLPAVVETAYSAADALEVDPAYDVDPDFRKALDAGIAAFRQSQFDEAVRAFQDAYLIDPNDPQLQSWLALVRDEQARREAITYALEDAREEVSLFEFDDEGWSERASDPPLWKRMFLPEHVPLDEEWEETLEEEEDAEIVADAPRRPLWKRLFLPKQIVSFDLASEVTPLEESRPEILDAGKRAGFQRLYKEGIGFQPMRGFGVSARTEIFEEPNPVDDYIIEAKIEGHESITDYRRAIVPLFTRSAATRFVTDFEPWPRFTYEFDFREIFHEFQTRFNFKQRELNTHAFNALYTLPTMPWLGDLTVNPWYKRVIAESNTDLGSFENRDEYLINLSLKPTENLEYFFQFEADQVSKQKSLGGSDVRLYKGQLRMRFPQWKLFVIPSYEYSITDFDPGEDEFSKRDWFVDWGFDVTNRLRASSKQQYVVGHQSQAGKSPSNPEARSFTTENTLSYELFKDFDVSFGLDYSKGIGLNAFNNVGLRTEVEYFRPGTLRAKFGYEWLSYYNIDEDLSLLFMKIFLFQ